ncbi:MAG: hypothetical protein ACI9RO_000886 [Alteromonas macleodii]|jgi:hypothetical protein
MLHMPFWSMLQSALEAPLFNNLILSNVDFDFESFFDEDFVVYFPLKYVLQNIHVAFVITIDANREVQRFGSG